MSIWFLIIAVMVASFIIQRVLSSKFNKYSNVPSPHGVTGADVARLMLAQNGITDVKENGSLMPSRVAVCAAHQANAAIRIILGLEP